MTAFFSKKYYWFFLGVLTVLVLVPGKIRAATLYFTPTNETVNLSEDFLVDVNLDAPDPLNALSAIISVSTETEVTDIIYGNSVINFWVEKPVYDATTRLLTFSGIIPNGFSGSNAKLITIKLRPQKEGSLNLSFLPDKTEAFLNSPDGSRDKLQLENINLSITRNAGPADLSPLQDNAPPESFGLQIAQDPDIFNGRNFLVFTTQDKGLGIDHYEIKETRVSLIFNVPLQKISWTIGESPYLLQDQNLTSQITVKAIDRAGNKTIAKLSPAKRLSWYKDWGIWIIILLTLAIVKFYIFKIRHKNLKSHLKPLE